MYAKVESIICNRVAICVQSLAIGLQQMGITLIYNLFTVFKTNTKKGAAPYDRQRHSPL